MGQFIFNPLTGEPTILATGRAKRTDQTGVVKSISSDKKEKSTEEELCYFCKGNEHLTPETLYQDADDWNVRVFNNKYPLLKDHEIIVHSPDHKRDFSELSCEQNARIIRAFLNRVGYHNSQDRETIIFNNRGGRAGASILHPHSQIVASKGFPGIIEKEKESALHYYNENNSCFWCDEVLKAVEEGNRIVHETAHFVAFVPEACRWSYEMKLVPKEHRPNFGYIDEPSINDLSRMLKAVLLAYDELFSRPDRNFWIHSMRYEPYHWHIGFIPHLKVFGALELGAGIWVSDKATPEDAATQLKKKINGTCEELEVSK